MLWLLIFFEIYLGFVRRRPIRLWRSTCNLEFNPEFPKRLRRTGRRQGKYEQLLAMTGNNVCNKKTRSQRREDSRAAAVFVLIILCRWERLC